jgi:hypothetical protein
MLLVRGVIAAVIGLVIAGVDNLAFEGEVSPILIVGMLLVVSAVMTALWRAQGALLTGVVWLWLPLIRSRVRRSAKPELKKLRPLRAGGNAEHGASSLLLLKTGCAECLP